MQTKYNPRKSVEKGKLFVGREAGADISFRLVLANQRRSTRSLSPTKGQMEPKKQLELLDEQGENEISKLFQVMCDITGETIPEASVLKWNEEEITKFHELGTFVTENQNEEATRAEDSLTGMRACLLMTAKTGHGSNMCDISCVFPVC
eukprot:3205827-Amphidinium_carterae.2